MGEGVWHIHKPLYTRLVIIIFIFQLRGHVHCPRVSRLVTGRVQTNIMALTLFPIIFFCNLRYLVNASCLDSFIHSKLLEFSFHIPEQKLQRGLSLVVRGPYVSPQTNCYGQCSVLIDQVSVTCLTLVWRK